MLNTCLKLWTVFRKARYSSIFVVTGFQIIFITVSEQTGNIMTRVKNTVHLFKIKNFLIILFAVMFNSIQNYFINPHGITFSSVWVVVDAYVCQQEKSSVAVGATAILNKFLTENILLLYNSLIKRMHRVVCNFLDFIKNLYLYNILAMLQNTSYLY